MRSPRLPLYSTATLIVIAVAASCSAVQRDFTAGGTGGGGAGAGEPASSSRTTSTHTGGTGAHTGSTGSNPTQAGGGGSTSAATTTTTTTTSSGGGGSGPTGTCSPTGQPFDIITTADAQGVKLKDRIQLVPATEGSQNFTYVIVQSDDESTLLIQLVGNGAPRYPVVQYTFSGESLHLRGAYALPGALYVFGGTRSSGVGTIHFFESNAQITDNTGFRQLPLPADCGNGFGGGLPVTSVTHAAFDSLNVPTGDVTGGTGGGAPSGPTYIATCTTPRSTTDLVVGDETGATLKVLVTDGDPTTTAMSPVSFGRVGGEYFAAFQLDSSNAQPSIAHGTDPGSLITLSPFVLDATPGALNVLFPLIPSAASDGLVVLGVTVPPTNTGGDFWSGEVPATQFGQLAAMASSALKKRATADDLTKVGPVQAPTWDAGHIYGAGATLGGTSIAQNWFRRDGTPVVLETDIITNAAVTFLVAASAPISPIQQLFVWVEQDMAGATSVRGQVVLCQGG